MPAPPDGPQNQFFTLQAMLSLTGATGATVIVSNGVQQAFNFNPRWFALAVSQLICLAGVYFSHGAGSDYFVGLVNGFLVYCTAAGATAIAGGQAQGAIARGASDADMPRGQSAGRRFFSSWF